LKTTFAVSRRRWRRASIMPSLHGHDEIV